MKQRVKERLSRRIQRYLNQACGAEAVRDHRRAEKLFWQALHGEGQLRPDITNPKQYAEATGPVYQETIEKRRARSQVQQIAVACTSRVRKHFLKNQRRTRRRKVSSRSARIASKMLAKLDKDRSLVDSLPRSAPIEGDTHADLVTEPACGVAESLALAS